MLSGSLDHSVKVYEAKTWTVTHSYKLKGEVMCVALAPGKDVLAVGYLGGKLVVKRRPEGNEDAKTAAQAIEAARLARKPHSGTRRHFMRGVKHEPGSARCASMLSV